MECGASICGGAYYRTFDLLVAHVVNFEYVKLKTILSFLMGYFILTCDNSAPHLQKAAGACYLLYWPGGDFSLLVLYTYFPIWLKFYVA